MDIFQFRISHGAICKQVATPLIKILSDTYSYLFSFLCILVLAIGGVLLFFAMKEGYNPILVTIFAFVVFFIFVLIVGLLATILDMRNCLRNFVELEKKKQKFLFKGINLGVNNLHPDDEPVQKRILRK